MIPGMKGSIATIVRQSRHIALAATRAMGISEFIAQSEWRRNRLLILCYHGISIDDEHEWEPGLFMSRSSFRSRLRLLRDEKCAVLPLDEAVNRLKDGTLPRKSVAVTFDDGFYNFYSVAAPLLRDFDIPATNYVSTFHCIDQKPILRLFIRYSLWRARQLQVHSVRLPDLADQFPVHDNQSIDATATVWWEWLRANVPDHDARLCSVQEVLKPYGVDCDAIRRRRLLGLMNVDELRAMAVQGIDIQMHTHRHRTPRDLVDFRGELLQNRAVLSDACNTAPAHFCYPSGDHDASFLPVLKECGVKSATTCETALATVADDPLLLPRFIDTMGQSETMFVSWLTGAAQFAARRARTSYD